MPQSPIRWILLRFGAYFPIFLSCPFPPSLGPETIPLVLNSCLSHCCDIARAYGCSLNFFALKNKGMEGCWLTILFQRYSESWHILGHRVIMGKRHWHILISKHLPPSSDSPFLLSLAAILRITDRKLGFSKSTVFSEPSLLKRKVFWSGLVFRWQLTPISFTKVLLLAEINTVGTC